MKLSRLLSFLGPDCVPLHYWEQLPGGKGRWAYWGTSARGDSTVCHLALAGISQCLGTDHQLCLGNVIPPASGTACAVHIWLDGVFTQYQWSYRLCHPGKYSVLTCFLGRDSSAWKAADLCGDSWAVPGIIGDPLTCVMEVVIAVLLGCSS